jgi:hypothetical protein
VTTIERLIESLQNCDPETPVNICLFDGDKIHLGDNVHVDDNGDFVLISGKLFHESEEGGK